MRKLLCAATSAVGLKILFFGSASFAAVNEFKAFECRPSSAGIAGIFGLKVKPLSETVSFQIYFGSDRNQSFRKAWNIDDQSPATAITVEIPKALCQQNGFTIGCTWNISSSTSQINGELPAKLFIGPWRKLTPLGDHLVPLNWQYEKTLGFMRMTLEMPKYGNANRKATVYRGVIPIMMSSFNFGEIPEEQCRNL